MTIYLSDMKDDPGSITMIVEGPGIWVCRSLTRAEATKLGKELIQQSLRLGAAHDTTEG